MSVMPTEPGIWRLASAERFSELASSWDSLNEASVRSPVLHSDFVGPLLKNFGDGGERIALFDASGTTRCASIIARANRFAWNSFQPSQAPIGLWLQSDGGGGLPPQAVFTALAARCGASVAMMGLNQLDPEHVVRPPDDRAGEACVTADYIRTARISITGSFDDYWAARGKNLRANMKKQRNKLEGEGVSLRLDCITEVSGVAGAITDFGRLESAGWKASGGTAVDPGNAQGRFYRAVFENFCARGAARIYRYFYGDHLVAMDLCIAHGGVMVILKTAFDESIKGSSPAFLMRHEYLPAIFSDRSFARIEFYGRVMDWHTKWSDEIRTLYHATLYRWRFAQRLDAMRRERRRDPAQDDVTAKSEAEA